MDSEQTFISIKLSKEEREELSRFAKEEMKLPLTSWIKHLVFREMQKLKKEMQTT